MLCFLLFCAYFLGVTGSSLDIRFSKYSYINTEKGYVD